MDLRMTVRQNLEGRDLYIFSWGNSGFIPTPIFFLGLSEHRYLPEALQVPRHLCSDSLMFILDFSQNSDAPTFKIMFTELGIVLSDGLPL